MKRFEVGTSYNVSGGGIITITKRTARYITYTGDFSGRRLIDNGDLFSLGEYVLIPVDGLQRFCFASFSV